jgi:DNA polymerase III subunit epsilon
MRQIFLDTETTGLSAANGDRMVEIGCVELVNRKLTGNNLHFYINPERDVPEEAAKVHGLTLDFLRDKPKFAELVDEICAFLQGAEVIIHNAPFDVGFLDKEFELVGRPTLSTYVASIVDTLAMAKEMFPGKPNSLNALCSRLDVDNSGRKFHGALLDAELLADVYINMTRGQNSLMMDGQGDDAHSSGSGSMVKIDLTALSLPVLQASDTELTQHEDVLGQIDKSSGGKTIWRNAA